MGQASHEAYLNDNRVDLTKTPSIEIGAAKVIGFGALHGSAKTEETEQILLQDLVKHKGLRFYFPETDFCTANYFQEYIESGDEKLLKEIIIEYKQRVPQEGSVEVFNKWRNLRPLFKEFNVRIVGIDKIASYKFSINEIIKLCKNVNNSYTDSLKLLVENQNTNWTSFAKTQVRSSIQRFVNHFENNKIDYFKNITDTALFNHIIFNLKQTFEQTNRTDVYIVNYENLNNKLNLSQSLQFFRFGVFHIMKSKINNSSTLFSKLIENNIYTSNEILAVQGFLTKSEVLWDLKYDKEGNYSGFTTKAGYGIADYWLEFYKGIKKLKQNKLSDMTLFYLVGADSPYKKADEYELLAIKKLIGKSFWNPENGKTTVDYIDYAIIISNSVANTPIEELGIECVSFNKK